MAHAQKTTRQRDTGPAKDVTKHFTLTLSSACILHAFENTFACVTAKVVPGRTCPLPCAIALC